MLDKILYFRYDSGMLYETIKGPLCFISLGRKKYPGVKYPSGGIDLIMFGDVLELNGQKIDITIQMQTDGIFKHIPGLLEATFGQKEVVLHKSIPY